MIKNIDQLIVSLFEGFNPKQQKVLTDRFGLKTGRRATLQEIGDELHVTRERVRQIEEQGIKKIKTRIEEQAGFLLDIAKEHLSRLGGVREDSVFIGEILKKAGFQSGSKHSEAKVRFVLLVAGIPSYHKEDDSFLAFWYTDKKAEKKFFDFIKQMTQFLKNADRDKLFKEKNYAGAVQEYKRFLDLHPIHKSAPYSQYRIGLSYFKQIKSIDRNIEPVQKALTAFDTVVKVYPGSDYINESMEKIKICRDKLAEREFYIGNFYMHKEDYQAAIVRFNNILSDYNDTSVAEKTLYHLGLAYSSSSKADKAKETLQNLLINYPESKYKEDASQLLAKLNSNL